jgi:acyl-CoA synthetase (NDP forming)
VRKGHGLDAFFRPRSIAILGASQNPQKIGGRPLATLQRFGYTGRIFPVNPGAAEVQGLPAFASLDNVPEVPDLALVALSAAQTPAAIDACAARGVRAAVIYSSNFAEVGEEGRALQAKIAATARDARIRVLGPNCLGMVSVADRTFATFTSALAEGAPPAGTIGIISQSGNVGAYVLMLARERGIGISRWMSTGNEADIEIADGIAWLARDPGTRVILCCLETCRDGPGLVSALEEARAAGKPVILLKTGSTAAGQAAAASHTGALAGADAVFDSVFESCGAWRAATVEELIDIGHAASLLLPDRLPAGRRAALFTASGGFGVLMADAAQTAGLDLPDPSIAAQRRILDLVPFASPRNPIDATAEVSSRPEILENALATLIEDGFCDMLTVLLTTTPYVERLRLVFEQALAAVRRRFPAQPFLVCTHGPAEFVGRLHAMGIPAVDGTTNACRVMAALAGLGAGLGSRRNEMPPPTKAAPLNPAQLADEVGAKRALAEAGIPVPRERLVRDADEAVTAAEALGFPVVLKIVSPDIAHKTEFGGVALGLGTAQAVRTAHAAILDSVRRGLPAARIEGVLVAPMVTGGTEMILGVTSDPVFGPVVMCGLGGIFAEVLRDVALRPAPLDEPTAERMLRSLRGFPLLDGARGRPRADLAALTGAIAALSRFAITHRDVVEEVDINPFVVLPEGRGAVALDALIVTRAGAQAGGR